MNKTFVLISLLTYSLAATALIEPGPGVAASTEIEMWSGEYSLRRAELQAGDSYPATGYTECRETSEIKSAYLCLSATQRDMNLALTRAAFFVEGTLGPETKGQLARLDNPSFHSYIRMFGGHDLRGRDLLAFFEAVERECESSGNDAMVCLNAHERDLFDTFIVPRARQDESFVIITFAERSAMGWREVVTHEIMHAQYFNDPRFRSVVDKFWENMSEQEKASIKSVLGENYNPEDEELMRNEFQAYILMADADSNLLYRFVSRYREPLMTEMAAAGVVPIQVQ